MLMQYIQFRMDLFEITFLYHECQKKEKKGNLKERKECIITQGGMKEGETINRCISLVFSFLPIKIFL